MRSNDLFIKNGVIYRLLSALDGKALIINCLEKKMPYWTNVELLGACETVTQEQLLNDTNTIFPDYDSIPQNKRKEMHL